MDRTKKAKIATTRGGPGHGLSVSKRLSFGGVNSSRQELSGTAALERLRASMEIVEAKGLLVGGRTKDLHGRMPPKLVEAAMEQTGITSETTLMEVALAHLVATDSYGNWLLAQRGKVGKDLDLEF